MATRQRDESRLRALLTQECARIMADEGVKDFLTAKRKAATRLRIANKALLPGNAEIEQALLEYQRLFKSTTQPFQLRALRETAANAMQFLTRFQARLVGPVLTGTAYSHANINLHVFADTSEDVLLFCWNRTYLPRRENGVYALAMENMPTCRYSASVPVKLQLS